MSATVTGEVVFYNGQFGFLRVADKASAFFPASLLAADLRKSLRLLDQVSCKTKIVAEGPHKGKYVATDISLQARGEASKYQRVVGKFHHVNDRHGLVRSPQLDKEVALYFNRLLDREDTLQDGELVVFSPVVSTKNAHELFAFFGYPLRNEKNALFLQEQLDASQIVEIQSFINQLGSSPLPWPEPLTIEGQFEVELNKLGMVKNSESYQALAALLARYRERGYRPSISVLENFVAPTFQIMLWENGLVPDYVPTLFHTYFQRASADTKRALVKKLTAEQRRKALRHSIDHLLASGKLTKANNEAKLLLDIVYRNPETRDEELYQRIYQALDLTPADWQQLWERGYVDRLPDSTSASPTEWLNRARVRYLVQSPQPALREKIRLFYEDGLLHHHAGDAFEGIYELALKAKLFAEFFPDEFKAFFPKVWPRYSSLVQLTLWLFDLPIALSDPSAAYIAQLDSLPHYLRVRYLLKKQANVRRHGLEGEVTTEGIIAFATHYLWNDLLYLVRTDQNLDLQAYYCFLDELEQFNELGMEQLDTGAVAVAIFEALPRYQVEHIRLYLQGKVPEDFLDFVGFREPFKKLTRLEKQELKRRFDGLGQHTVAIHQQQGVVPCQDFKDEEGQCLYTAYLENLYFSLEKVQLRLEDGSFTFPFTNDLLEQKASRGLNSLPVESKYNELPIQVWVVDKQIRKVASLEYLFDLLQEDEIVFALGRPDSGGPGTRDSDAAYAEDWALKEQVVAYLGTASDEHRIVLEPTNYYRRLDEDSPIEGYEKTVLYTLLTSDGAAIVWENVDFSEDRSTYVFKASTENLAVQIDKIDRAIRTHAQLRSALSSKQTSEARRIFQRYYGYVGTIRKKRGRNQSFEDWQGRLMVAMQQAPPPLPTDLEWEQTRHQQLGNSSPPRPSGRTPGRKVTKIDTDTLDRVNPDTLERVSVDPTVHKGAKIVETPLLTTLRKFNNFFCAGLPHKNSNQ